MAVISGIRELRGIIVLSADGCELARVKKQFFEQMPLCEGDVIDESAYLDRMAALQFGAAYEAALDCLDYSARTASELRRSLTHKGFVPGAVEAAIERLQEARLIDDAAYARRMVENSAGKQLGVYALKRKLRAKGLSEEDAEAALSLVDESAQTAGAIALAGRLLPRYCALERREVRAKLSQALARRGFGWDVITAALDEVFSADDD